MDGGGRRGRGFGGKGRVVRCGYVLCVFFLGEVKDFGGEEFDVWNYCLC